MRQQAKLSRFTSTGFTLIEALVVVSIAAILMSMAAPSYRNFTMNSVLISQANQFNSILQFARSQAAKDRWEVTLCTSDNSSSSTPTCANHGNWETGWIVFATNPNDGTTILHKVSDNTTNAITFRASNFNSNRLIKYNAQGTLANNDSRGTFTFCDARGAGSAKAIIINAVGRTQRALDQNSNGKVEDDSGAEVTCP